MAAGLEILDALADDRRLRGWPQLHIARGALLARLARHDEAADAYRRALELHPPPLEAAFVTSRIEELRSSQ
jgi:RNA polymerase sigma-70 factor (ECF subfamily)